MTSSTTKDASKLAATGYPLPPARCLRMSPGDLDLYIYRTDKSEKSEDARQLFYEEERNLVADPETGFSYFVLNYGSYIPEKGGDRTALSLWEYQETHLVPALNAEESLIVLKARRFGFTMLVLHYIAWVCCWSSEGMNAKTLASSNKGESSRELLEEFLQIVGYVNQVAPWLACPVGDKSVSKTGNRGTENTSRVDIAHRGSSFRVLPPGQGIRGKGLAVLFLDELGLYEGTADPKKVMPAASPVIVGGGKLIIGSTSGGRTGKGKVFHDLWSESKKGNTGYNPLFIPRSARSEYTEEFMKQQIAVMGVVDAYREYPESPEEAFTEDPEGSAFDYGHIESAIKLGALVRRENRGVSKPNMSDVGIDWGHSGTGWSVKLDQANFGILIARAGSFKPQDAETIAHELVKTAKKEADDVNREMYDPGGSGAQANKTFARHYPGIRRQKVAFGRRKRENIDFIRLMLRRTHQAIEEGQPLSGIIGYLAIDAEKCPELVQQLQEAKTGSSGGLKKVDEQHTLDSLIAIVNQSRADWSRYITKS